MSAASRFLLAAMPYIPCAIIASLLHTITFGDSPRENHTATHSDDRESAFVLAFTSLLAILI